MVRCYWWQVVLCSSRFVGLRKRFVYLVAAKRHLCHHSNIKGTPAQRYMDCNFIQSTYWPDWWVILYISIVMNIIFENFISLLYLTDLYIYELHKSQLSKICAAIYKIMYFIILTFIVLLLNRFLPRSSANREKVSLYFIRCWHRCYACCIWRAIQTTEKSTENLWFFTLHRWLRWQFL